MTTWNPAISIPCTKAIDAPHHTGTIFTMFNGVSINPFGFLVCTGHTFSFFSSFPVPIGPQGNPGVHRAPLPAVGLAVGLYEIEHAVDVIVLVEYALLQIHALDGRKFFRQDAALPGPVCEGTLEAAPDSRHHGFEGVVIAYEVQPEGPKGGAYAGGVVGFAARLLLQFSRHRHILFSDRSSSS